MSFGDTKAKIAPCPFCGHKDNAYDGYHRVFCIGCGAMGPDKNAQLTAAMRWNHRPKPKP